MPGVPVLAGQPSLYTITQLFLFREGRRNNEAMVALAKPMKDADLRGFSDYIGTLPPVPAPAPAAAARRGAHEQGQGPRAAAQVHVLPRRRPGRRPAGAAHRWPEGGLRAPTLRGFKSGDRPGYTRAMTEALSQVPVEDLDLLAYYVANFTGK